MRRLQTSRTLEAKPVAQRNGFRLTLLPAALAAACALACFLTFSAQARRHPSVTIRQAPPSIERLEPPDWWVNSSVRPLRLLVYGSNLQNATATADSAAARILAVSANEAGTHAFITLDFDPAAQPGGFDIRLQTQSGAATARFVIRESLSPSGRNDGFTTDDVIYLLMPDRFSDGDPNNNDPAESRGLYSRTNPRGYHGGDLQGIIDRLPYLKDLGITAIWMTPVYDNSNRARDFDYARGVTDYHGYGAINFYGVEERFGDLDKFRELVKRAHALGLKIIQDQVPNHTGPDHLWASAPPTPTWLNGTPAQHLNNAFDIKSVAEENPNRERFEATLRGWFANLLPDINQDDPLAAEYLIQNSIWWLGTTGLDGVRLDTFPYVPRRFWAQWNQAMRREFPRAKSVGEVFDGRPEVVAFFQGGRTRFDSIDSEQYTVFDFPLYFAMRDVFLKGQPLTRLNDVLAQDHLYPNASALVTFLGNHDVPRFMGEAGASVNAFKQAVTVLLTVRGTPQLYYGDEIGLEGGGDPDNRRDFPGGFPGDKRNAFTPQGRKNKERKIFNHVRKLLRARAAHTSLRQGSLRVLLVSDQHFAFVRESARERALIVINQSGQPAKIEVPMDDLTTSATGLSARRQWQELFPYVNGWRGRAVGAKLVIPVNAFDAKILIEKR